MQILRSATGAAAQSWKQSPSAFVSSSLSVTVLKSTQQDWLFQHVVNSFCHIRKAAERSRENITHGEAMRVRDSVFSNLAMHVFKTLTNACESLSGMATEDFAESRRLIPGVVAKGGRYVPTWLASQVASFHRLELAGMEQECRRIGTCC